MSTLKWTVMVYFAADNDLSEKAIKSLLQMWKIGSTDQVHVLAQVDLLNPTDHSLRYTIGESSGSWKEERIPESNGGAVKDFVDFVEWGSTEEHRAERYLIVIWAHANGIFDNPDHARLAASPVLEQPAISPVLATGLPPTLDTVLNAATEVKSSLPSVESIAPDNHPGRKLTELCLDSIGGDNHPGRKFTETGIDVTSGDALTTRELGEALAQVRQKLGKKIAIFGVDACLMSMVEVAQQINESASLMVASQQTIPDTSWPYESILRKLVDEPTLDERRLATVIVEEYIKAYQSQTAHQVTLSACDLEKTEPLVQAIAKLRLALAEMLPIKGLREELVRARFAVQSFMIQDFVDLFDLCRLLLAALSQESLQPVCAASGLACQNVKNACKEIMSIISKDDNSGFVIASGSTSGPGGLLDKAKGVSLYFPMIPPIYKDLVFSSKSGWNQFLNNYASALLQGDDAGDSLKLSAASSVSGNGKTPTGGITK